MQFPAAIAETSFSNIAQKSLQLEQVKVLDVYDVKKDNYLRKTGALVVEKETGQMYVDFLFPCQ